MLYMASAGMYYDNEREREHLSPPQLYSAPQFSNVVPLGQI